eukprot:Seg2502.3 transcript_id=Seg2502.3/GoldUCD/mRNA.D3Y31 product="hypothetical protein" protein_id=Seg2502.3/GoldUCD/D3Y31
MASLWKFASLILVVIHTANPSHDRKGKTTPEKTNKSSYKKLQLQNSLQARLKILSDFIHSKENHLGLTEYSMKDLTQIMDGTKRSLSQKSPHFLHDIVPTLNHLSSDKNITRTSYINNLSRLMNVTGLDRWASKDDRASTYNRSSSQPVALLNYLNWYLDSSGTDTNPGRGIITNNQEEVNKALTVKANSTFVDSRSISNLGRQMQNNSVPFRAKLAADRQDKQFEMNLRKPIQETKRFTNMTYNGLKLKSNVKYSKHSSKPSRLKDVKLHRLHRSRTIKRSKKKSKQRKQKYRNKKLLRKDKTLKQRIKLFMKDLELLLQSSSDQNLIRSFTNEMEHSVRNIDTKNKKAKKLKSHRKYQSGRSIHKALTDINNKSIFDIARRYHVNNRTLLSYIRAQNVLRSGWPYITGMRRNLTLHTLLDTLRYRVQISHNNSLLLSKQNNTVRNASSSEIRTNTSSVKEKPKNINTTSRKNDTKLSEQLSMTHISPSYVISSSYVLKTPTLIGPPKTLQSLSTLQSSAIVTSQIVSKQSSTSAFPLRNDTLLLAHETNFSESSLIKPTQVQPSSSLQKAASQFMTDGDASSGDRLISDLLDAYKIVLKEKIVYTNASDTSVTVTQISSVRTLSPTKVVSVMPLTDSVSLIISSPSSQLLIPSSSHTRILVPMKANEASDPRHLNVAESMPAILNEEEISKNRSTSKEDHSLVSNTSLSSKDRLFANATEEDKELYLLQNLKDLFTGKLNVSVPILQPESSPTLEDKKYNNNHTPTPPLSEDDPNLDVVNEMDLITALAESDAAVENQENSTNKDLSQFDASNKATEEGVHNPAFGTDHEDKTAVVSPSISSIKPTQEGFHDPNAGTEPQDKATDDIQLIALLKNYSSSSYIYTFQLIRMD